MRIEYSNFINMIRAVYDLFMNRKSLWQNKPVIGRSISDLDSTLTKVAREATLQEQNRTKGYTSEKDKYRKLLIERLFVFTSRLKVYADTAGNEVVSTQMTFSRTQLEKLPMRSLLVKASNALEAAASLQPLPEMYEITDTDIQALRELVITTEGLYAHRDAKHGEHSVNTVTLKNLIALLRKQIKQLDTQVNAFIDDEEFVQTYTFTRRIRDTRGGSKRKDENA